LPIRHPGLKTGALFDSAPIFSYPTLGNHGADEARYSYGIRQCLCKKLVIQKTYSFRGAKECAIGEDFAGISVADHNFFGRIKSEFTSEIHLHTGDSELH
jgi:hypothetical protein